MIQRINDAELPEVSRIFYNNGHKFIEYTDGTILPVIRGGATEDGFEDDDDDGSSDDSESNDDDDDGDDEDSGEEDKSKNEAKLRSEEAKRYRLRAKNYKAQLDKVTAELEQLKRDGVSDEETKRKLDELTKVSDERDSLRKELDLMRVGNAVRDHMSDLKLNPKRTKAILRVIDLDDVDVEEDGTVEGVREALEQIAQDYPEWVLDPGGDEDDDEGSRRRTSGRSSGKPRGKSKGGIDRNELASKFPALLS